MDGGGHTHTGHTVRHPVTGAQRPVAVASRAARVETQGAAPNTGKAAIIILGLTESYLRRRREHLRHVVASPGVTAALHHRIDLLVLTRIMVVDMYLFSLRCLASRLMPV